MGRHTVTEEGFSPRSHLCPLLTDSHSPHACPTPGVYTFTVTKTVLRLLTSLALGFSNRPDRKSQSSVAATGPLPGVLTSSAHSLTWRESLTGLATCLFNHNHLPHLERVLHTGQTTCFLQLGFQHSRATTRLNTNIHWPASHTQSSTARPQQSTGNTDTGFPKLVTDRRYNITRLNNYGTFGFPNQQYRTDSRLRFRGCVRVYRDPTQRLNGSGKDSPEQTPKTEVDHGHP
jgi:hypothetical protein